MGNQCNQLKQKMLIKMLMHSSLTCRLSTSAFRVRQYSFRLEYSQSSPKISFFITQLKLSSDLLKFSRRILRQTVSITLLISAKGFSEASFINRRVTKSTCSFLSADCQTKMLQNRMQEVRVKVPVAMRVSMSMRTSQGSSRRMMFWKNQSFQRQLTKVSLSCMGQLKMQSLGFILRSSNWNFLERQAMRDQCSTICAACTFSPKGSYSTCRYSPKQRSRLFRSSTRTTCFTDSLSAAPRPVLISPSLLASRSSLELRCWRGEIHFFLTKGTGSETVGLLVLVLMMASIRFCSIFLRMRSLSSSSLGSSGGLCLPMRLSRWSGCLLFLTRQMSDRCSSFVLEYILLLLYYNIPQQENHSWSNYIHIPYAFPWGNWMQNWNDLSQSISYKTHTF